MKQRVTIEKLDHFGKGIAHIGAIPVFVSNSLPGETVEIEITKQKKKFMEARVIEYIQTSPNRVEPICPFYDVCGGCDIMHMDYDHQLQVKQQKVEEVMHKFGLEIPIQPILSTTSFNYRNKVTLQVKEKVGYYQKHSYEIVPIDHCEIASLPINSVIKRLSNIPLPEIEQIMIRSVPDIMLYLKGTTLPKGLLEAFSDVASIYFNHQLLKGKEALTIFLDSYYFTISKDSFFQVNTDGMQTLYRQVKQYSALQGTEQVLDLYCGTGTIGIYLSRYCKQVLGIEMNPEAIKDANKNREINAIQNIEFICGDTGSVLKQTKFMPDVVIVDPPRSGLQENAIKQLQKLSCQKIIYVSCDVVTLARDLKLLQTDYDILEITPVDMFPNTSHVECVCLLEKR